MKSWIAAWVFVFASAMLFAVLLDREKRRQNVPVALLMLAVMATSAGIFLFR